MWLRLHLSGRARPSVRLDLDGLGLGVPPGAVSNSSPATVRCGDKQKVTRAMRYRERYSMPPRRAVAATVAAPRLQVSVMSGILYIRRVAGGRGGDNFVQAERHNKTI